MKSVEFSAVQRALTHVKATGMNTDTAYVMGLDGGGSGCRAAISDRDGTIVHLASGDPANYTSDPDGTVASILRTVTRLAKDMAIPVEHLFGVPLHLGIAGITTPKDADALAARLPFSMCSISDDQVIAVTGALGDGDGALIGVGTGSFVALKRAGRVTSLGGWGLALGDQASGAWLGQQALQICALVADDLAEPSPLTTTLLNHFQTRPGQMVGFAKTAQPVDYAKIAPVVFDAADAGDVHAQALIAEAAHYLNQCLRQHGVLSTDAICLTGGLADRYLTYLEPEYQACLTAPKGSPLDGALDLAQNLVASDLRTRDAQSD